MILDSRARHPLFLCGLAGFYNRLPRGSQAFAEKSRKNEREKIKENKGKIAEKETGKGGRGKVEEKGRA